MKKLSEAVYRSPKWLQRFADFEFRTGEDIKGEPSEKQKEKIRKQQEQQRKEREEKERQARIEKEERERQARIARDRWERERREREAEQKRSDEQERLERELNDLFNRIVRDFQNNPWSDKFDTPTVGGKTTFKYRFENGWTFEMKYNEIIYTDDKYRHGYTVGLIWRNKFVQLANEIIAKGKRRPTSSSGKSGHDYQKKSEPFRETPKTGNPQRDKYNTLNDKIKLREEQLRKMKPNDPDRTALENELNAYKRVRDKMKKEHKFENLKTFEGFFDFLKTKNKKEDNKSKTWKEKFDLIWNTYQKLKDEDKVDILSKPTVDVKEDSFSVALGLSPFLSFVKNHKRYGEMVVVDFDYFDRSDLDSREGVYVITQSEYDSYLKKAEIMSDWLDELSERETGKSGSSISDTGDLNLDIDEGELALWEFSEKVKSAIQLPKSLEFEISYHLWTSNSTNELITERFNFVINDLKFDHGGGRFWCELFTKDPFGNDAYMWIESDSSHEYFDFEKNKWPYDKDKLIKVDLVKKEMTRKEEREYSKNRKFPYALWYEVTPCKWESMEFIKEITSILKEMNLGLNKNI